jgi:AraC family transcriptional regulator
MKTTEQSYRERLDRVIAFLHANLETDIGIEALSDVACLSNCHSHRIYTAMCGETVAVTLRRLRLKRVADRLANSDVEISMIAGLAQYGSQDAFLRAVLTWQDVEHFLANYPYSTIQVARVKLVSFF